VKYYKFEPKQTRVILPKIPETDELTEAEIRNNITVVLAAYILHLLRRVEELLLRLMMVLFIMLLLLLMLFTRKNKLSPNTNLGCWRGWG
jgi:ABC-type iron transport system FetAB permease component